MRILRGSVTDKDGNPLPGAGVVVKDVKGVGVSTDLDGKFEISVPQNAKTLVFSSLGMETVEYVIPQRIGGGGIEITLGYEENFLDQVVVTRLQLSVSQDLWALFLQINLKHRLWLRSVR